jgi:hypothetical protein
MLRGVREGWVVAVSACGLLCVALVGVGCGSAEEAASLGSVAEEEGGFSAESELRRRARRWQPARTTTNRPTTDAGSATTPTPPTGQPTSTETTTPPPAPPNTGVVDSSNSGGTCPNNRAMPAGGACGPYGVNCTYDDGSGTHYCLCLSSGPTGVQGWSCR